MRFKRLNASLLALGLTIGLAGCDELLQVSNPNDIEAKNIMKIAAANALVNGALSGVARGYGYILTSYSTVTDELQWVGSRDAYTQHDMGNLGNPFNEFTDDEYTFIAQGVWMANEAVRVLTIHAASTDPDSSLEDPENLGWAHVYRAIAYLTLGDMFDDAVISDRAVAGTPVGEANMSTMYTEAITSLGTAISIGNAEGDAALTLTATAFRASAHHRLAIWNKVGTRPIDTSNNGLAASAAAVADANAALALMTGGDWSYDFVYTAGTVTSNIGFWVNSRLEMRISPVYATPDPTGAPTFTVVSITDLIDNTTVHPYLDSYLPAFKASIDTPTMPVVSAREMHLIIAEDALAGGDAAGFTTAINNLRALDGGLTPYSGQVAAQALLEQSRQINLFMMGRRLADHYRFQNPSAQWIAGSTAMTAPGTFFPITIIECRANENIPNTCS